MIFGSICLLSSTIGMYVLIERSEKLEKGYTINEGLGIVEKT